MFALSDNNETRYDPKMMKTIVMKLLDKAGNDKRLTLRILRNKTEDKLKLQRGELKDKRNDIKVLTYKWWKTNNNNNNNNSGTTTAAEKADGKTSTSKQQNNSSSSTSTSSSSSSSPDEWSQLVVLAKAVGKGSLCKSLDADTTITNNKEKSNQLRKKLRELGYKFSDIPTSQEIDKVKKVYELKKEAASLKQNNGNLGAAATTTATSEGEKKRKLSDGEHSKDDKKDDKEKSIKSEKLSHSSSNGNGSSTSTAEATFSTTTAIAADTSASSNTITKKAVVKYDSDEEEGDF